MTLFPGVAGEIELIIGREQTARLLQRWGGCQVNIPKSAAGSKFAEVIGVDATEAIIRDFGYGKVTLPCASMRGAGGRKAEAIRMLNQGASLQDVALALDIHTRTVSNYRAEIEAVAATRQMSLDFDNGAASLTD